MKQPDELQRELVQQWLDRANEDFDAAELLLREGGRFRGVIAFHAQQAVEKYLKAVLVRHQIDFPKTHDIGRLLERIAVVHPVASAALAGSDILTPYGVEVRYPSDAPELLPGEEVQAVQIARQTRDQILTLLSSYLVES
ncbi:MAG: HEPN domain-containing protein [Bryobacterales bacterium]|nr:HEPN domain-containing protein [Bryobacterales bacterium]